MAQPALSVTTISVTVGSSGASAPIWQAVSMAAYTIRTTISFASGGTGYAFGYGINATTGPGFPGLTTGIMINNSTGLLIDGPAPFYLACLGATTQFSMVQELSVL